MPAQATGAWPSPAARRRATALSIVSVVLPVLSAAGQDALRNALSIDTSLSQSQNTALHPGGMHWGPVQWSVGIYGDTEFNDNINLSESGQQSDVILHSGLNLGLLWPATERSVLQFGAGLGYLYYVEHNQYGGLEVSPNSALSWQIGLEDVNLSLYDQISYQQQVTQQAQLANITTLPRLENTVGLRVDWLPGSWRLQGSYSHDNFLSTDSAFDYLDRASEFFSGRAAWRFAEKTEAGVEGSLGLTSYQQPIQPDNASASVGVYTDWQVTQYLHTILRGGPTLYWFSSPTGTQNSALNSYYASLSVDHALTQFISQQLTLQRDVSLGLSLGSAYVEQFTANYSISVALTQRVNVGGTITYEQGTQPFLVSLGNNFFISQTEDFDRAGFGANVSWSLTDHFSAGLRYNFWDRHSSLPERSYLQNIVALQLNYNF
jgi:hypothetical protein